MPAYFTVRKNPLANAFIRHSLKSYACQAVWHVRRISQRPVKCHFRFSTRASAVRSSRFSVLIASYLVKSRVQICKVSKLHIDQYLYAGVRIILKHRTGTVEFSEAIATHRAATITNHSTAVEQ